MLTPLETKILKTTLPRVLPQLEILLRSLDNKYIWNDEKTDVKFDTSHTVVFGIFLYLFSRCVQTKSTELADKLYYLNKAMHGVDWYHQIELPQIFFAEHPVGTVLGRATYSDYFFFYQSCTVGGNKGQYPTFGAFVTMYSGSKVLGKAHIGSHCVISANTYIKDESIPGYSVVFGQSPDLTIKQYSEDEFVQFQLPWTKMKESSRI